MKAIKNKDTAVMTQQQQGYILRSGMLFVSLSLALFLLIFIVTFFYYVRKPEVVSVPNILQFDLTEAQLELQKRELNTRLQLRFSNNIENRGLVIEQSPKPGSLVPLASKVLLTVSKGVLAEQVPNFVGQSIDKLQKELQQQRRSSTGTSIAIERQIFIESTEPAGTIIQQAPRAGSSVSGDIDLKIWLSRGKGAFKYQMPSYLGRAALEVASELAQQNRPFQMQFTNESNVANSALIITQKPEVQEEIGSNSDYIFTITKPKRDESSVFDIFQFTLSNYPAAVDIRLEARLPNQLQEVLFKSKHLGGSISVPYLLPSGSEVSLFVNEQLIEKQRVGQL